MSTTSDTSGSDVRVGARGPRGRGYRSAPIAALRRATGEATTGVLARLRRALRRTSSDIPFTLRIDGSAQTFATGDDFARALLNRATVSGRAAAALETESADRLARQASTALALRRRLASLLAPGHDDPAALARSMGALDTREMTRDRDWRAIFEALAAHDEKADEYRRLALAGFLRYLTDRERLVEWIQSSPGHESRRPRQSEAGASLETYRRLPMGATIRAHPDKDGVIKLRFGRHRMRLRVGDPPTLLDDRERTFPLRRGDQLAGRDPGCMVPLPADLDEVSRQHVRIELREAGAVFIVDLSTNGTFIAGRFEEVTPSELMRWRGLA